MALLIQPYETQHHEQLVALSLRAWAPVFSQLQPAVAQYVYNAFYPNGWQERQRRDIESLLKGEADKIWVAIRDGDLVGWVGIRLHQEDSMGEIYILAVDPEAQRQSVARSLIEASFELMRKAGMKIVMVETGDDPGHEPSRATYEKAGFERWPVARYFREL